MATVTDTGIELIEGWQKAYRLYSVWFFVLLGSLGDIVNALNAAGIVFDEKVPSSVANLLNLIAAIGIVARVVRQKKLAADIEAAKTGTAPAA